MPVLTVISGFLLFSSGIDREPMRCFAKKSRTILIPFLCFNLTLLPFALGAEMFAGMELSANLWPFDPTRWLNAAFGLTGSPINYPLNFLRDLIVLMLLAPLFGWLLRHYAWPGFVLVLVVFMGNFDGNFLLRDLMAVSFYIGGLAAVRNWNLSLLDRYAGICFIAFLVACAVIVHFRIANTTHLRLAAPFLVWPATVLIVRTSLGSWLVRMSKYSFFLFLAHAPVLLMTWVLYGRYGNLIPYPVYWVLAPICVGAVLIAVYKLAMATMPRVFRVMIGASARSRSPSVPGAQRGDGDDRATPVKG